MYSDEQFVRGLRKLARDMRRLDSLVLEGFDIEQAANILSDELLREDKTQS